MLSAAAIAVCLAAVARVHAGDARFALGRAADLELTAAEIERLRAAVGVPSTRRRHAGATRGVTHGRAEAARAIGVGLALVDDTAVPLISPGRGRALHRLCDNRETLALAALVRARTAFVLL
jgi:hypothetical protein